MGPDDTSRRTPSPLARAAVLLSSGSLAALLVVRSGPGCGEAPAPETPKATPAPEVPKAAPAESPKFDVEVPAKAAEPPAVAPQPGPAKAEEPAPPAGGAANANKRNAEPAYFPASKAGVFHERAPNPAPEPAPQQQQAAPK